MATSILWVEETYIQDSNTRRACSGHALQHVSNGMSIRCLPSLHCDPRLTNYYTFKCTRDPISAGLTSFNVLSYPVWEEISEWKRHLSRELHTWRPMFSAGTAYMCVYIHTPGTFIYSCSAADWNNWLSKIDLPKDTLKLVQFENVESVRLLMCNLPWRIN